MIEKCIVVEVRDLCLDEEVYDTLADFYEVTNDSYHRYYMSDTWDYIKKDIKEKINSKLNQLGVLPITDNSLQSRYILLRFDW